MHHLHSGAEQAEGLPSSFRRTTLLVLAVTLHNIRKAWLSVCHSLAAAHRQRRIVCSRRRACHRHRHSEFPGEERSRASAPSGGLSRTRSFVYGSLSGIVEPIFGVPSNAVRVRADTVHAVAAVRCGRRDAMRCGRGADSRAHLGEHSHPGTLGVMAGFSGDDGAGYSFTG